jgi:hypothetical protein
MGLWLEQAGRVPLLKHRVELEQAGWWSDGRSSQRKLMWHLLRCAGVA